MNELENLLAKMKGQACWSMIGISAGSMFTLDFGAQLKRGIVIGNDLLRKEQREFCGEYCLFVNMTGWKLYYGSECICHCNDSNKNDGPMVLGLSQLEGKKMLRHKFRNSPAELMIAFSENYRLFLCDWEGSEPDEDAYILFDEDEGISITVKMNGEVSTEPSKRFSKKENKT
jgi:hypothetical protein